MGTMLRQLPLGDVVELLQHSVSIIVRQAARRNRLEQMKFDVTRANTPLAVGHYFARTVDGHRGALTALPRRRYTIAQFWVL